MRVLIICLAVALPHLIQAEDWPQWLGTKRDGVWRETGILEKFPKDGPETVWRTKIGSGYAGPAVADGRVYLIDRVLSPNAQNPENPFKRGEIPGTERVLCLDEKDGSEIWKYSYESNYTVSYASGPRATPIVDGGKVYTLGAEGVLHCLNSVDGLVIWKKDFNQVYGLKTQVWGYAGAPLVYQDLLICLVGGDGTTAVAFDKNTGEEKWRNLSSKTPGYCPPTLIHHGGKDQVIIWNPESINSLNPETGKLYWSLPWLIRAGLSIPTPRLDGDHLFFTSFYNGSTMLKLKADQSKPEILWQTEKESEKRTVHLNAIMPTPVLRDGLIFGTCSYGEFRCLDQNTGERLWESMQPSTGDGRKIRWFNNFLTPIGDRYILFSERGELILANISRDGFEEIDRAVVIEPNGQDLRQREIVWSHPAYANQSAYIRNDSEIIKVSLRAE